MPQDLSPATLWRSRWVRTPVLFLAGVGAAYLTARLWAPHWPGFCSGITVDEPCSRVEVQTMTGYLVIALGFIVMIIGPIAGALIELIRHGHDWETPRGPETVVANLPIGVGLAFVLLGLLLAATA